MRLKSPLMHSQELRIATNPLSQSLLEFASQRLLRFVAPQTSKDCPTSKMSHDYGWRGSCAAGGVTDMVVGSGALLGIFLFRDTLSGLRTLNLTLLSMHPPALATSNSGSENAALRDFIPPLLLGCRPNLELSAVGAHERLILIPPPS